MPAKRLRVASEADTPTPSTPPKTLIEAVESGTYLEILVAQRRQMVTDLSDANGPALAALHRQIALHSKEIASLKAAAEQEASEDGDVPDQAFDASAV